MRLATLAATDLLNLTVRGYVISTKTSVTIASFADHIVLLVNVGSYKAITSVQTMKGSTLAMITAPCCCSMLVGLFERFLVLVGLTLWLDWRRFHVRRVGRFFSE